MAKRNEPNPLTAKVIPAHIGSKTGFTLPVNPGFADPNEIDEQRGVDVVFNPDRFTLQAPAEVHQAERAIASVVLAEYFPVDLRAWIGRQARRRGGTAQLTRELMAMRPVPTGRDEVKFEKALRRSIERSGPAQKAERKEEHRTIRNADYGMRIALLELRDKVAQLGVMGVFAIYRGTPKEDRDFRWFYTDRSDRPAGGKDDYHTRRAQLESAKVYQILGRGGADFVRYVAEVANTLERPMVLEKVHGLGVQVMRHD